MPRIRKDTMIFVFGGDESNTTQGRVSPANAYAKHFTNLLKYLNALDEENNFSTYFDAPTSVIAFYGYFKHGQDYVLPNLHHILNCYASGLIKNPYFDQAHYKKKFNCTKTQAMLDFEIILEIKSNETLYAILSFLLLSNSIQALDSVMQIKDAEKTLRRKLGSQVHFCFLAHGSKPDAMSSTKLSLYLKNKRTLFSFIKEDMPIEEDESQRTDAWLKESGWASQNGTLVFVESCYGGGFFGTDKAVKNILDAKNILFISGIPANTTGTMASTQSLRLFRHTIKQMSSTPGIEHQASLFHLSGTEKEWRITLNSMFVKRISLAAELQQLSLTI